MTGRHDDERTDVPLPQRGTDSDSATNFPTPQSGVVQDSPGNPDLDLEGGSLLDEQGNYGQGGEDNVVDDATHR